MCGIAGYAGAGPHDAALLQRMCDALTSRGPDDDGYYLGNGVGLGMRRLAIIDVAHGRQPITNEDQTVVVVFNGEIYNFQELRRELEDRGHRFSTTSDTECIVHLYEDHGEACVERLRGMFAFALWDDRARRLMLARDRVGKKPLYYRHAGGRLWFGSELKALLQDPSLPRALDPVALDLYLAYQYVPEPWSILEGVSKLPPAHTLVFEGGRIRLRRYWRLEFARKSRMDVVEATEEFRRLLLEATRLRMIAERPLGAFLSGGVDSALVVAAMAEASSRPVETFCIGFDDDGYDERDAARRIAHRLGTAHHELVVRPDIDDILPDFVRAFDEPFADSSAIPTLYLARMARRSVVVALNGDGGDEAFAGYLRYAAHTVASAVPVPDGVRKAVGGVLARLPAGRSDRTLYARARRFVMPAFAARRTRYFRWMCHFGEELRRTMYEGRLAETLSAARAEELLARRFDESTATSLLERTLDVDLHTYLPGDVLVKADRATMAYSLEARSPLLDHRVLEFAASLPPRFKMRWSPPRLETKYLLRRALRAMVGDEAAERPKKGFSVPMAAWLRGRLRPLAEDLLMGPTSRQRGLFKPAAVRNLLTAHLSGEDHSTRIWNLIVLELWQRRYLDGRSELAGEALR